MASIIAQEGLPLLCELGRARPGRHVPKVIMPPTWEQQEEVNGQAADVPPPPPPPTEPPPPPPPPTEPLPPWREKKPRPPAHAPWEVEGQPAAVHKVEKTTTSNSCPPWKKPKIEMADTQAAQPVPEKVVKMEMADTKTAHVKKEMADTKAAQPVHVKQEMADTLTAQVKKELPEAGASLQKVKKKTVAKPKGSVGEQLMTAVEINDKKITRKILHELYEERKKRGLLPVKSESSTKKDDDGTEEKAYDDGIEENASCDPYMTMVMTPEDDDTEQTSHDDEAGEQFNAGNPQGDDPKDWQWHDADAEEDAP